MTCSEFEEALAEALGHGPGGAASPDAARHLRGCKPCQDRARQALRLDESLRRALEPYPSTLEERLPGVLEGVDQDLRRSGSDLVAAAQTRIENLPRKGAPGRRGAALFAAGLFAAAVLGVFFLRPPSQESSHPVVPEPGEGAPEPSRGDRARAEKSWEQELARLKEERRQVEERRARLERESRDVAEAKRSPSPEENSPSERARRETEAELARLAAREKAAGEALEKSREKERKEPPTLKGEPRSTVSAVARLERVAGTVYVISSSPERTPARGGQELVAGQSLVSEGPQSSASVAGNGVTLQVSADSTLRFGAVETSLLQGRIEIAATRAASLATPHARIELASGRFVLHAWPESTYFESRQGTARFNSSPVGAGQFAISGAKAVDQARIDKAIKNGAEFLKKAPSPPYAAAGIANSDALILLTLVHAGVPEDDPRFQELLKNLLSAPLDRTYPVALQAMVLEELDRLKYQPRIADCARFLLDNQCKNGQWTYGTPTPSTGGAFVDSRPDVATAAKLDAQGRRIKPKVTKKIAVQKMRDGPPEGDNSNSQYAALGLRACHDAGIVVPPDVLLQAARWWRDCQYADKEDRKNAYNGKGWCYHDGKGKVNGSDCCRYTYASMTAGAVGSLVIYDHLLGKDWRSDVNVRLGMEWLTSNFSVAWNFKWGKETPGDPENQGAHFYYLYALERLGVFTGQERMGRHEWYAEGATVILERQRPDGSWIDITLDNSPVWDTCFSILFLRRATRPLQDVPSVDRSQKR